MQKVSTVLAIVLSFLIIALMHFGWLYYMEEGGPAARRVEVRVPPGATLHDVQSVLVELGLLKRPGIFRWAAYLSGSEKGIKTGRYLFRPGESVSKILSKLARGEVDYIRIAIPEGLMLKEISGLLQEKAEIDSIRFVELARDAAFVGEMGIEAPSLEGYLFPDTYLFNWPLTARDVAERIVHRFNEVFGDSMRARADTLGLSVNEVVTLASIIQAEAVFDSEMPRISAVYHNRLRRRWRLEADPTVAYAIGGVRRRLWHKDLRVKSPYNTYRVRGLPPGAICSPGRVALDAAVRPLGRCKDLYFVADGTGRHYFTGTLSEHLRAKERVKAGRVPWKRKVEPDEDAAKTREVTSE